LRFDKTKIRKVFENRLFDITEHRHGKENNYKIVVNGKFMARVTVPKGRGDIKPGTMRSIVSQTLLPKDKFSDLASCPFSQIDYINFLVQNEANS